MNNLEIKNALSTEIIRLLDDKYSGGARLPELVADITEWALKNNISTSGLADDVVEIVESEENPIIDCVWYPWRGKRKIFVFLSYELVHITSRSQ